jgi:succinoglycan biosynthesis protein ExoL
MLNRCSSIIVTSTAFKEYIVQKYLLEDHKIQVVENKLQLGDFFTSEDKILFKQIDNNFTIGIIGYLRYKNIIDFLEAFRFNDNNNFKIVIYGDGHLKKQILQYVDDDSIKYFGQFKYPDDIKRIYSQIDLAFSMYDSNDLNVRLALPNKLYEAMYFRKPIIVSSNTYLSDNVEKYGIGIKWDQDDMTNLIKYLNSSDFIEDYKLFEKEFNEIGPNIYLQ